MQQVEPCTGTSRSLPRSLSRAASETALDCELQAQGGRLKLSGSNAYRAIPFTIEGAYEQESVCGSVFRRFGCLEKILRDEGR